MSRSYIQLQKLNYLISDNNGYLDKFVGHDCDTRSVIARLSMLNHSAAWEFTFILGNVPNFRIIPGSEDSKQQKELLVDPNPPLTSNEEYLNFSSNKATRLSIRSPCLRITKHAWDWMTNHFLWPFSGLYLEFWNTQDRVSYFLWNLGDYSAYLILFFDETPPRTTFLL